MLVALDLKSDLQNPGSIRPESQPYENANSPVIADGAVLRSTCQT